MLAHGYRFDLLEKARDPNDRVNKVASRILRLALSAVIIVGLVLFARTVNWHATWDWQIREAD